jgi:hypothetical protein
LRPLLDVGLHEELTADSEKARYLPDELLAYQEAFLVTLLPPWVREVHEYARDRPLRLEALQREACVFREDACPLSEASSAEPRVNDAGPFAAHFEPQKSQPGFGLGALDEKPPPSRSDLELQPLTGHERAQVDTISTGESRRVFVGAQHGNHERLRDA